ncbi:hypothetical protein SAMN05444853_1062 [Pasteurella skyensis]|uniref:Uncharacterized protein n=1 Tax=Phocoenobacter skyensis TaxID=97481 RepID=A0A1H7VWS8_9PAST|nr:hypothetical protein SAMN05444853_1062 [Pasteurella skyensis]
MALFVGKVSGMIAVKICKYYPYICLLAIINNYFFICMSGQDHTCKLTICSLFILFKRLNAKQKLFN